MIKQYFFAFYFCTVKKEKLQPKRRKRSPNNNDYLTDGKKREYFRKRNNISLIRDAFRIKRITGANVLISVA